ncbi:MAG TPA: sialidase family protein [Actinomycetota bacterium]
MPSTTRISRRAVLGVVLTVGMWGALSSSGTALANVPIQVVSLDPYTNTSSFHRTEVEPDTFSFGNTIVGVHQTGRFNDGGSSNVGYVTSTNGGSTWTNGFLPGTTVFANPPGPYDRDTDPAVAYDPRHDVWMVNTLGMTGTIGKAILVNRSTDGGLTFQNPVTVATSQGTFFDKNWITCDTWAASPFYGNCYVEWDDNGLGNLLKLYRSTDGGLTWTPSSAPGSSVIGGVPVVQPNGTVVVPIDNGFEGSVESFVSTNGGVSYTGPFIVSTISAHFVQGNLRVHELPSAEVDASGKVYVVWNDCRFRSGCSSNDIVMSTSTNGTSWTPVTRIPIDPTNSTVDHFIPGIAVDRGTQGNTAHLGLTYYYYPVANCSSSTCRLTLGYVQSPDGGATWTTAVQVSGPFKNTWLPLTNQGYMVGDYMSTSFVNGKAYPILIVARRGTCQLGQIRSCKVTSAIPVGGLAPAAGTIPVRHDPVLYTGPSQVATGTHASAN